MEDWLPIVPVAAILMALCVAAGAQERAEAMVALREHEESIERLRRGSDEIIDTVFDVTKNCEQLWEKHRLKCTYDMVHSPGKSWLRDRAAIDCPRCTIATELLNAN